MKGRLSHRQKPVKGSAPRRGLGQEKLNLDERLASLHAEHERGDEWAWVLAVSLCAQQEVPMPPWAAAEWLERSFRAVVAQVDSWDNVLPPIKARGQKRRSVEQDLVYGTAVLMAVIWAHSPRRRVTEELPDERSLPLGPIDDSLFERLCTAYGWPFGPDKAKKLFYQIRREKHLSRYLEAGGLYLLRSRKTSWKQTTSTKRGKP